MTSTDLALVSEKCGVMSTLQPSEDKSFLFYCIISSVLNQIQVILLKFTSLS